VQEDVRAHRVSFASYFDGLLLIVTAFVHGRSTLPAVHPGFQSDAL
jgi:hypothetical protein